MGLIHTHTHTYLDDEASGVVSVYIGVVRVYMQYKCVYYCDTYLNHEACSAGLEVQRVDGTVAGYLKVGLIGILV
jgi:hypothetical protein